MKKKGKVKFADHSKGYGYILSDDAVSPTETLLFEVEDLSSEFDAIVPGTTVIFEVDEKNAASQARNIEMA